MMGVSVPLSREAPRSFTCETHASSSNQMPYDLRSDSGYMLSDK